MKPHIWCLIWILFPAAACASSWSYETPIDITAAVGPKIFHHLDSAGRKNIAVTESTIAVTWEDERDGVPRIYLARKDMDATGFNTEIRISGEGEAYEPSLTALAGDRFAVAWEEDGKVMARIIGPKTLGTAIAITANDSTQAHILSHENALFILAAVSGDKHNRIMLFRNEVNQGLGLMKIDHCPVDAMPPKDEQLYPAAVFQSGRLQVAWEDRRPGHTIIMSASQKETDSCEFLPPVRLSLRPKNMPNLPFGKGHGVARVALAVFGNNQVMAAWADKRDFREGYDVYSAEHQADGKFGENTRVQDDFGGQARQWHTAITGHPDGQIVVAWDDDREGNADVMLSWQEENEWSEDFPLPAGSGPGEQSHPSMILDRQGNLHIAWVERSSAGGPTRLRYCLGRHEREQ